MKAIRLIQPRRRLELTEIPVPEPASHEVLIRVRAAGICHSDAHYRAGRSPVHPLPLTLGHEVAGIVEKIGSEIPDFSPGDRVCVHYLATCGQCNYCLKGIEQFCPSGQMIGKHRDGGYAEFMVMPGRSVLKLPAEIPFEQGAILMCSAATSLHALRKARLCTGESVAVFGVGGLGCSAIQLARALGAGQVFAVDIKPRKLELGRKLGGIAVDAARSDPVQEIKLLTEDRGADVALELIGLPSTMQQAVRCLGVGGRAALVGLTDQTFQIAPYAELINKEAEIIGVSDHLAQELPELIQFVQQGKLDLTSVVTRKIPLQAEAVNEALDGLERVNEDVRTVLVP